MVEEKKPIGILVKKEENFSEWYVEVVLKSGLADYSPVKGCIVFKPLGYAIWEKIVMELDGRIKERGVKNVYFPLFIPESFLKKEAEHFEGFVPQCAWITIGGEKELGEKLAVRPTSETIIYATLSKWIRSHRDLPLRINQWCNVVRWEKVTHPFIRTTEFLWQEGHTAHESKEEAESEAKEMLCLYQGFIRDYLAIPVLIGMKSEEEKFRGALYTLTLEALMPDGKALQLGTSHNLGQKFSKAFEITFIGRDGEKHYVWQTSWGLTTRLIGAIAMTHGDDRGLILPPLIAPTQVVIIPIYYKEKEKKVVLKKARKVKEKFERARISVALDDREEYTPGWKFNEWELRGVPLRIEIGPKDVKGKRAILVRRDNFKQRKVRDEALVRETKKTLDEVQNSLLARAERFLRENTRKVKRYKDFKEILRSKRGFIKACWCGSSDCELKVKEETGATIRLLPLKPEKPLLPCICCGKKAKYVAYFAKAY
jgi:prolyl-tRNA synthetase